MKHHIIWVLGLIMFGMGASTERNDFKRVAKKPWLVVVGVILQYTIMPLLALAIGKVLGLEKEYAFELIIIGSCPGGTASNVIVFLSKGNVPLSISMTLISTLLAPLLTPAIIYWLLSAEVNLSFYTLMKIPLYVVLIPVVGGILGKLFFDKAIRKIQFVFPVISVLGISLIIAGIIALNHERVVALTAIVFLAVIIHNLLGLLCGYWIARLCLADSKEARTIAIEVGMQNSALGAAIVSGTPAFSFLSGVPSAIFSVWHNVSGSLLARIWSKGNKKRTSAEKPF